MTTLSDIKQALEAKREAYASWLDAPFYDGEERETLTAIEAQLEALLTDDTIEALVNVATIATDFATKQVPQTGDRHELAALRLMLQAWQDEFAAALEAFHKEADHA